MGTHQHSDSGSSPAGDSCCSTRPERTTDKGSCCAPRSGPGEMAVDPICGMTVDRTEPAGGSLVVDGQPYYFCSTFCRAKFAGASVAKEPA